MQEEAKDPALDSFAELAPGGTAQFEWPQLSPPVFWALVCVVLTVVYTALQRRRLTAKMETSTRPWEGAGNMMAIGFKVSRGDRPPVASGAVGQLVARCWAAEPAARPTMEQAMRELAQLA